MPVFSRKWVTWTIPWKKSISSPAPHPHEGNKTCFCNSQCIQRNACSAQWTRLEPFDKVRLVGKDTLGKKEGEVPFYKIKSVNGNLVWFSSFILLFDRKKRHGFGYGWSWSQYPSGPPEQLEVGKEVYYRNRKKLNMPLQKGQISFPRQCSTFSQLP